jgi:hypothetical protein
MDFETLQRRLLARVRNRVQNGEMTERGLARMTGISQPHMHHILKGVRRLSVENADRILWQLNMSVMDLLEGGEPSWHIPPRKRCDGVGIRQRRAGFDAATRVDGWVPATKWKGVASEKHGIL